MVQELNSLKVTSTHSRRVNSTGTKLTETHEYTQQERRVNGTGTKLTQTYKYSQQERRAVQFRLHFRQCKKEIYRNSRTGSGQLQVTTCQMHEQVC